MNNSFILIFLIFSHVVISCDKSPPKARSISLEASSQTMSSADDLPLTLRATVVGFSPSQVTLFEEGEGEPLGDMQPQPDGPGTTFEISMDTLPEVRMHRFYAIGFGDGDDTTSNVVEVTVDTGDVEASTTFEADLLPATEDKSAATYTFTVTTDVADAAHAILYEVVDGKGENRGELPIAAGSQGASFGLTYTATDNGPHTYYVEIVDAQGHLLSRSEDRTIEVNIPSPATSAGEPAVAIAVVGAEGNVVTDADQEVKLVVTSENIALEDGSGTIALFAEIAEGLAEGRLAEGQPLERHDAKNGGTEFSLSFTSFTYLNNGDYTYVACAEVGSDDPICAEVTLQVNIPGVELAAGDGQRTIERDGGETAVLTASVYGTVAKVGLYYYEDGAEGDAQPYGDVLASGATTYGFEVGEKLLDGVTYAFFAVVYAEADADTADFVARSPLADEVRVTWKKAETSVASSWSVTLSAAGADVVDGVVTADGPLTLTAILQDLAQESVVAIAWTEGGQPIDESGLAYQTAFTHGDNGDHVFGVTVKSNGEEETAELTLKVDIVHVDVVFTEGPASITADDDTVTFGATVYGSQVKSVGLHGYVEGGDREGASLLDSTEVIYNDGENSFNARLAILGSQLADDATYVFYAAVYDSKSDLNESTLLQRSEDSDTKVTVDIVSSSDLPQVLLSSGSLEDGDTLTAPTTVTFTATVRNAPSGTVATLYEDGSPLNTNTRTFNHLDNGEHVYQARITVEGTEYPSEGFSLTVNIPWVGLAFKAGADGKIGDTGDTVTVVATVYGWDIANVKLYVAAQGSSRGAAYGRAETVSWREDGQLNTEIEFTIGSDVSSANGDFQVYAVATDRNGGEVYNSQGVGEVEVERRVPAPPSPSVTLTASNGITDGATVTEAQTVTFNVELENIAGSPQVTFTDGGVSESSISRTFNRILTHQQNGSHTYEVCVDGQPNVCDTFDLMVNIPWVDLALGDGDDGAIDNADDTVSLIATVYGTAATKVTLVAGQSGDVVTLDLGTPTLGTPRIAEFYLTKDDVDGDIGITAEARDSSEGILATSQAVAVSRAVFVTLTGPNIEGTVEDNAVADFTLDSYGFVGPVQVCCSGSGGEVCGEESVGSLERQKVVALDFSSVGNGNYVCKGTFNLINTNEVAVEVSLAGVTLSSNRSYAFVGQRIVFTPTSRDGSDSMTVCLGDAAICTTSSGTACSGYELQDTDADTWTFYAAVGDSCTPGTSATVAVTRQWVELKVNGNVVDTMDVANAGEAEVVAVCHNCTSEQMNTLRLVDRDTADVIFDPGILEPDGSTFATRTFRRTFDHTDNGQYFYVLSAQVPLGGNVDIAELTVAVDIVYVELTSTDPPVELLGPLDTEQFSIAYWGTVDTIELYAAGREEPGVLVGTWSVAVEDAGPQHGTLDTELSAADFPGDVEILYAVAKRTGEETRSVAVAVNIASFLTPTAQNVCVTTGDATVVLTLHNFGLSDSGQVCCHSAAAADDDDALCSGDVAVSNTATQDVVLDFASAENGDYTCQGTFGETQTNEVTITVARPDVTLSVLSSSAFAGNTAILTPTSQDGDTIDVFLAGVDGPICSVVSGQDCTYLLPETDEDAWRFYAEISGNEEDICAGHWNTKEVTRPWVELSGVSGGVIASDGKVMVTEVGSLGVTFTFHGMNINEAVFSLKENSDAADWTLEGSTFEQRMDHNKNGSYSYVLSIQVGNERVTLAELNVEVDIAHVELSLISPTLSPSQATSVVILQYWGSADTIELLATNENKEVVVRRWDANNELTTKRVIGDAVIQAADFAPLVESESSDSNFSVYAVMKKAGTERDRSESVSVAIDTTTPFLTLAVVLSETDDGDTSAMVFPDNTEIKLKLTHWGAGNFCNVQVCNKGDASACSDFPDGLEETSVDVLFADNNSVEYTVSYGLDNGSACTGSTKTNDVTVYAGSLQWYLVEDATGKNSLGDGPVTKFPGESLEFLVLVPMGAVPVVGIGTGLGDYVERFSWCRYEFSGTSEDSVEVTATTKSYDGKTLRTTSTIVDVKGEGTIRTVSINVPDDCTLPNAVKFVNGDEKAAGCGYALAPNGRNEIILASNVGLRAAANSDGETGTDTIKGDVDIRGTKDKKNEFIEVSGLSSVRPWRIGAGADVTFSNLRITNNIVSADMFMAGRGGDWGGCIYNEGSVRMNKVIVERCSASYGGCIYNKGVLEMNESDVSSCYATSSDDGGGAYGGGIYNEGDLNMEYSNIDNCSAASSDDGAGAYGGGIYNEGTLQMNGSGIVSCSAASSGTNADAFGGCISNMGVIESISGPSGFQGCSATSSAAAAYGGGIYSDPGTSMVIDSMFLSYNTVEGSSKAFGGALFVDIGAGIGSGECAVQLYRVRIEYNSLIVSPTATEAKGGGIAIDSGCVFGDQSVIGGNQIRVETDDLTGIFDVNAEGGGVYNKGDFTWNGWWSTTDRLGNRLGNRLVKGNDDSDWSDYDGNGHDLANYGTAILNSCPGVGRYGLADDGVFTEGGSLTTTCE